MRKPVTLEQREMLANPIEAYKFFNIAAFKQRSKMTEEEKEADNKISEEENYIQTTDI